VCRQLPDGAEVGLLRPLGESGELQILVHALAKRGAHEWSFPNEGRKTRLETTPAPPLWYITGTGARCSGAVSRGGLGERLELILPGSGLLKPNGCPIWLHYTGGNRGKCSST